MTCIHKYVFSVFVRMFYRSMFCNMDDIAAANLALANGKVTPTWCVEKDKTYPLRKYIQDLELWTLATDVLEARRGPVVVLRLTGSARDLMRDMPGDMLTNGQDVFDFNGVLIEHRTGVQCIVRALTDRFGALDQEVQIFNVSELMTFQRQAGETTDQCIARFNSVSYRAVLLGGIQAYGPTIRAWVILTHLKLPRSVWPMLLTATLGLLPATEDEYNAMISFVRRNAHLYENQGDRQKTLQQPYFVEPDNSSYTSWPSESTNEWHYPVSQNSWTETKPFEDDVMSWHSFSTANSHPSEDIDWTDINDIPPGPALDEHLYVAYRFAKRRFRAVGHKRNRFKGTARKGGKGTKGFKGSGKGKGKPHFNPVSGFWTDSNVDDDYEVVVSYFKGGKGGKGGRSGNPLDKNGKQMECSLCGSIEHFWRQCSKGKGKGGAGAGKGSGQPKGSGKPHHFEFQPGWTPPASSSASTVAPSFTGFSLTDPASSNFLRIPNVVPESAQPRTSHTRITFMDGSAPVVVLPARSNDATLVSAQFESTTYAWWPADYSEPSETVQDICNYHTKVRLPTGEAFVVDTGAVNGLAGSQWVSRVAAEAALFGQGTLIEPLARKHSVGGVGQSNSVCVESATLPICLEDGGSGTYKCLVVPNSEIPGLLPFDSMEKRRVLLDTFNGQYFEIGSGGYDITLSAGSRVLPLVKAPTGHPMLAVSCWKQHKAAAAKKAY